MSTADFFTWYDYHTARFPGLRAWLEKLSEGEQQRVYGLWQETLSPVALADAQAASQVMFEDGGVRSYERHVIEVLRLARKRAYRPRPEPEYTVEGQPTYKCLKCEDDGRLICWHRRSMQAARDGNLGEPFTVYTCAVACICDAGKRWPWLPDYGSANWLIQRPTSSVEEQREELHSFVTSGGRNGVRVAR